MQKVVFAEIAEIIGYAGFDYVLIDTEYGPFEIQAAQEYIHAVKLAGTTPLTHVKDSPRYSILKILDVGAMGLVIPHLHKVDEIKRVVEYGKYYPICVVKIHKCSSVSNRKSQKGRHLSPILMHVI